MRASQHINSPNIDYNLWNIAQYTNTHTFPRYPHEKDRISQIIHNIVTEIHE